MTKKTTKKIKTAKERTQKELVKIFEKFCKGLLSEKAKFNKLLKKQNSFVEQKNNI